MGVRELLVVHLEVALVVVLLEARRELVREAVADQLREDGGRLSSVSLPPHLVLRETTEGGLEGVPLEVEGQDARAPLLAVAEEP
eukprot:415997-Alexandrium_andersonii.AAC.1